MRKTRELLKKEILTLLEGFAPEAVRLNEIAKKLAIKSDSQDYDDLRGALDALETEKAVHKSTRRRYTLRDPKDLSNLQGTLELDEHRGIVTTGDEDMPFVYVKRQNLSNALPGDTVRVRLVSMKAGNKPYGAVTSVVKRADHVFTGTIDFDGDFYFLSPDDRRIPFDFLVHERNLKGAKVGSKASAKFVRWDDEHKNPELAVTEVLGLASDIGNKVKALIAESGFSVDFPAAVQAEMTTLAFPDIGIEKQKRRDLTGELIITIDPEDAKDFDDALSLQELDNGHYLLGVHIADVSAYVPEKTALDTEALRRGNSTYLFDRVIPMLPEHLSNNLCSLVPHADRLAFTVMIELSPRAVVKNYEIVETVICSKRRYSYDEVGAILDGADDANAEFLRKLHKVSLALRKRRFAKGGVDFFSKETRFELDDQGQPVRAYFKTASESTRLVEECMLIANQVVAEHVSKLGRTWKLKSALPFLYRVHDEPDPEKLRDVLSFVQSLGVETRLANLSSLEINDVLSRVEHLPEKPVIHQFILRAMAKAEYSHDNVGHYGLGFSDYAHFTSPIRRYPDLVVHRLLKEYALGPATRSRLVQIFDALGHAGEHCSITERQSVELERACQRLAQADIARRHIGLEFDGTINGVTTFGLFVSLDDLNIEGLVHVRDLSGDYFRFDEKTYTMKGRRRNKEYRIGMRVRVRIVNASVDRREVDLNLVESLSVEL